MSKGKNHQSPAEDYIDQLHWQTNHYRRRVPVRFEPKWKYKIRYRIPPTTPFDHIMRLVLIIGVVVIVSSLIFTDSAPTGDKIFFGSIAALITAILFVAVKDISKDKEDEPENIDE